MQSIAAINDHGAQNNAMPITTEIPLANPSPKENQNIVDEDGFEIFIGRMPLGTTDEQLREIANPYNPKEIRVLGRPDRNNHMCGFVVFTELASAQKFIADHDEQPSMGQNCNLNVRFADGKTRKKVFVGGLAAGTDEEQLKSIASHYGVVLTVKILSKNPKAPCGFVVFATSAQAEACIAGMNDMPNSEGIKNYVVRFAKAPAGEAGSGKGGKGKGKGKGGFNNKRGSHELFPDPHQIIMQHHFESPNKRFMHATTLPGFTTTPHSYGQMTPSTTTSSLNPVSPAYGLSLSMSPQHTTGEHSTAHLMTIPPPQYHTLSTQPHFEPLHLGGYQQPAPQIYQLATTATGYAPLQPLQPLQPTQQPQFGAPTTTSAYAAPATISQSSYAAPAPAPAPASSEQQPSTSYLS